MRADYINPFVDSAQNVIEGLVPSSINIKRSALLLKESLSANGISATIFLAGAVEGRIVLDLEPEVAKKIAGAMNGIEVCEMDHLAIDTICELTNIIIGKAVTALNNKGFRFKSSPPSFFIGEKIFHGLESLCISLHTTWGEVKIQAAIKDKK